MGSAASGSCVTEAGIGVGAYDGPTVGDNVGAATAISHTCDSIQNKNGMYFIDLHWLPRFASEEDDCMKIELD